MEDVALIIVAALGSLMGSGLLIGLILIVRDTIRKRGRWGINLRPVFCPDCGLPAPAIRKPKNARQTMWGGCTCTGCGTEYDKWGYPVETGSKKTTEDQ